MIPSLLWGLLNFTQFDWFCNGFGLRSMVCVTHNMFFDVVLDLYNHPQFMVLFLENVLTLMIVILSLYYYWPKWHLYLFLSFWNKCNVIWPMEKDMSKKKRKKKLPCSGQLASFAWIKSCYKKILQPSILHIRDVLQPSLY